MKSNRKIVFFDGVCNLCNGFINFIFKYNNNETLQVASLQGETANKYLSTQEKEVLSTVIYYRDGKKYTQSSAVLLVFKDMGLPFNLMTIFIIIPKFIRDFIYQMIARNRYRLFGAKETCRLPTESERNRFLP